MGLVVCERPLATTTEQHAWYYAKDGAQHGPVSIADLRRMATANELSPEDLIWREGMADWTAAKNLKRLFGNPSPSGVGSSHVLSGEIGSSPSSLLQMRSAIARQRGKQRMLTIRVSLCASAIVLSLILVGLLFLQWNAAATDDARTAIAAFYAAILVAVFACAGAGDRMLRLFHDEK